MRDKVLDQLEVELGILIRRIRRASWERTGYVVLGMIAEQAPVRAADLCSMIGTDKAAVSRHVQHLLEAGFVVASPDPDDGRANLLRATDAGRAELELIGSQRRERLHQRLGEWNDDDLSTFVAGLERYNADMT